MPRREVGSVGWPAAAVLIALFFAFLDKILAFLG